MAGTAQDLPVLHWIDIAIIGAYIVYSISSGLRGAKDAKQSLEEYFLAGRTLKGWQAGISMAATQFAADTPLVVTGLIATSGVFSLWRMWIYALAFLFMALVLGASWRRSGVITDAALTELRYGGRPAAILRGAKAIYFGFIFNCTVLAMVLLATTRITEPFLIWDQWLPESVFGAAHYLFTSVGFPLTASGSLCSPEVACGIGECIRERCIGEGEWIASTNNALSIAAIVLVTTLYSTTGGLRAVVKTDIAQFAIAIVSTLIYAVIVIVAVGGLSNLSTRLLEVFPADGSGPSGMTASEVLAFTPGESHDVTWVVLGVILIQWICQINADGSGYLAQRTMACRSEKDARQAGIIFAVTQVFFRSLVWLPIGVGLLILFPPEPEWSDSILAAKSEATFVRGIAELLPTGVRGLMITGMLGALASTVDTHLNWGSSYFTNDLYKRFIAKHLLKKEPSPTSLVWVARISNFGILAIALSILPLMDSIQMAWKASLLLGAGVGILLILRWLWWRMNAMGELMALVASLVYAPLLLFFVTEDSLTSVDIDMDVDGARLLLMAGLATGTGIASALLTAPEDPTLLKNFYEKAKPPGYWDPVSSNPSYDRYRLWVNLLLTFGGGFAIFAALTGVGAWILGSPPPAWLPSSDVFVAVNLVAAVLLGYGAWRLNRGRLERAKAEENV